MKKRTEKLLEASRALLENAFSLEDVFVDEDNEDKDYPRDELGRRWYWDWWELKQALELFREKL